MIENLRPTTRSGIKSLAREIKKSGSKYHHALDTASQQAGFQNWADANRLLTEISVPRTLEPLHKARFVAYWRDFEAKKAGVEEIEFSLRRPLSELIKAERAMRASYVGGFTNEGGGWLVDRSLRCWCQEVAVGGIETAARTLQFIDHTGLRPSYSRKNLRPGGRVIPGRDHLTAWFDPIARKHVLVDEPYGLKGLDDERAAWALRYNRQILKPNWKGMHNPTGGTEAYLIAEVGYHLAGLCNLLDSMPAESDWKRDSRPNIYY